jgi:hypothetical protein
MAKTNTPKIRPHNKIAQILLSGKVVNVEDIKASFAADAKMSKLMYRLSTFIYDIRKYDNGVVKVVKDGRKVTAYQLVNFKDFDSNGCFSGSTKSAAPVVNAPVQETTETV